MSWSFIGCAVRLAQELGIHNIYFGSEKERGPITWEEERCLRTWICGLPSWLCVLDERSHAPSQIATTPTVTSRFVWAGTPSFKPVRSASPVRRPCRQSC